MKNLKYYLLVLSISWVSAAKAQLQDKDDMIRKIFAVFRHKDEKGYLSLFPDAEKTRGFIRKMMKEDSVFSEQRGYDEMLKKVSDEQLRGEYTSDFHRYLAEGEDKGVVWERASLVSYIMDSLFNDEVNVSELKGKIYFRVDTVEYFMRYGSVLQFEPGAWYGVSVEDIDLKRNEQEGFDREHHSEPDSTVVLATTVPGADTTMAVKPVRTKSKKTPVKKKPAPAKQKSPVRKEEG